MLTAGRRGIRKMVVALLVVVGVLSTAALAVAAQGVASVELSGVVILRVRDAGSWDSVYARADEIYRRINEVINTRGAELSPDQVGYRAAGRGYVVTVGEDVIVTVTPVDAQLNAATPEVLARIWATNLKAALRQFVAIHRTPQPPVF